MRFQSQMSLATKIQLQRLVENTFFFLVSRSPSPSPIPHVTLPSLSPLWLICFLNCSPSNSSSQYSNSQQPWSETIQLFYQLALLLQLPLPQILMYLSMLWDFWIPLLKIPTLVLFYSLAQIQMVVLLQILVYWIVPISLVV